MKVTLFHIGGYKGDTTKYLKEICDDNNLEFTSYIFEPSQQWFNYLAREFDDADFVYLYNVGVSNVNSICSLYHTPNDDGFTLHSTKWNVKNVNDYERVKCIIFSEWYNANIKKSKDDFFVMQCSINGGEYELFTDLIDNNLSNEFDIYCGKIFGNLSKLTNKTKEEVDAFKALLIRNNIEPIALVPTTLHNLDIIEERIVAASENKPKTQTKKESAPRKIQAQPKDEHVVDVIQTAKEIITPETKRSTRGKRSKTK